MSTKTEYYSVIKIIKKNFDTVTHTILYTHICNDTYNTLEESI